ncbi:MAG: DUF5752 family protein [Candidatus Krumholzibacteriia bacterium]
MMTGPQVDSGQPFEFLRASFLVEVTPYKAATLGQLLTAATLAPDTSLFYHLHQGYFRSPDRLPEYPNDFAFWAHASLGDFVVAERLANLSPTRHSEIGGVRREISVILAEHLQESGDGRRVSPESEFIFCRPCGVISHSGRRAKTPAEFVELLGDVEIDVIFYHLFTPKLLRGAGTNDFAAWFRDRGYERLAARLGAFDPYLNSLEDNRAYMIEIISHALGEPGGGGAHA